MDDSGRLSTEELEQSYEMGMAMFCSAYVQLMTRELGIDVQDKEALKPMILQMVEPMNDATEAVWRALMHDHLGKEEALIRFRKALLEI